MTNPFRSDFECLGSFCERPTEFAYLCSAAINGLNVILSGRRGQGRTSLLTRVLDEVSGDACGIYVSCRGIALFDEDLESALAISIVNGILGAYPEFEERIREDLLRYDPIIEMSGERQKFEFGGASKPRLGEIFELWNLANLQHERKGLIVFDDFHLILGQRIENQLRALIQQNPSTSHMFVVGQGKRFEQWFMNSERPFFRSGSHIALDNIPDESWSVFLSGEFGKIGVTVVEDMVLEILEICERHTATVMAVCSVLADLGAHRPIFKADVSRALRIVVRQHSAYVWSILEGLTSNQRALLVALAKEKEPVKPYTKGFFSKSDLSSTSIQKIVPVLAERELIIENLDGTINLLDPLFRQAILNEAVSKSYYDR